MKLFFVRHGESVANISRTHTTSDTDVLSPAGKKQARALSRRLANLPIEYIASSPLGRARETAEIINKTLRVQIEFVDILREREFPDELRGMSYDDPESLRIENLRETHWHKTDWRFSNEETSGELKERALQILVYLRGLSRQEVLVVAHAEIIKTITAAMMFSEEMSAREVGVWFSFGKLNHTGVTECLWDEKTEKWRLICWNDLRHLD